MKDIIINILNQCIYNKSFNDYKKIEKFIVTLDNYNLELANVEYDTKDIDLGYESIFISFWTTYQNKRKLISILFSNSDYIVISQICGCHDIVYCMNHCIQYHDIKNKLTNHDGEII